MGMFYAFAAAVQPGPYQTYLISEALVHGWRRTLPAALAPILSDGPIILLVLFLLTRVPAWALRILQGGGGIYLLFLAFQAWKTWKQFAPQPPPRSPRGHRTLLKAALVNFLNPNPYLGWSLVMGPLLLSAWQQDPVRGIGFVAGFYGTMVACGMGIIFLSAGARKTGPRIHRLLVGISAAGLACFGVYQLSLGVLGSH